MRMWLQDSTCLTLFFEGGQKGKMHRQLWYHFPLTVGTVVTCLTLGSTSMVRATLTPSNNAFEYWRDTQSLWTNRMIFCDSILSEPISREYLCLKARLHVCVDMGINLFHYYPTSPPPQPPAHTRVVGEESRLCSAAHGSD